MPFSRMLRAAIALAGVLIAAGACTVFTPRTASSTNNYAGAAVFAGSAIAGAGVNRAVTGQCWAQCPPGNTCNHATGLCERVQCSSTCPADLKCERVGNEFVCVQPRSEGLKLRLADAGPDAPPASLPASTDDAGAKAAASSSSSQGASSEAGPPNTTAQ